MSHTGIKTLAILRLVSKRWRFLLDEFYPKELVIENCDYSTTRERAWFATGRPIQEDSVLRNMTNLNSIKFKLNGLRRFAIGNLASFDHAKHKAFDFRTLNQFSYLEHLEVSTVYLWREETLSMPHLKRFSLICIDRNCSRPLIVDAPMLQVVCCLNGLDYVRFVRPETVKELRLHTNDPCLERFSNVEVLKFDHPASIRPEICRQLPHLKRLHFEANKLNDVIDYEQIKLIMDAVLKQEQVTENKLKVFFRDTPLAKRGQKFDDYELFFYYDIFGTSADHMLELDEFDGLDDFDGLDEFDWLHDFEG